MENYRIKIVNGIFAGYSGLLGAGFEFVDGVSVEELPTSVAQMIAAEGDSYVVDADGEYVLDEECRPYKVTPGSMPFPDAVTESFYLPEKVQVRYEEEIQIDEPKKDDLADAEPEVSTDLQTYSRQQLEAVADKEGMRGLREIGDKFGAKGKSIPELIEKILNKCGVK